MHLVDIVLIPIRCSFFYLLLSASAVELGKFGDSVLRNKVR